MAGRATAPGHPPARPPGLVAQSLIQLLDNPWGAALVAQKLGLALQFLYPRERVTDALTVRIVRVTEVLPNRMIGYDYVRTDTRAFLFEHMRSFELHLPQRQLIPPVSDEEVEATARRVDWGIPHARRVQLVRETLSALREVKRGR